jgi:hypothetical protein
MSIHDLIKPRQRLALKCYDEDVETLLENSNLNDFEYQNIHQQERLAALLARWPLLGETISARGEAQS